MKKKMGTPHGPWSGWRLHGMVAVRLQPSVPRWRAVSEYSVTVNSFIESEVLTSLKAAERPRPCSTHKAALHLHFACVCQKEKHVLHRDVKTRCRSFVLHHSHTLSSWVSSVQTCCLAESHRSVWKPPSYYVCVCVFMFSFWTRTAQDVMCPAAHCLFCTGNRMLTQRRAHQPATGPNTNRLLTAPYTGVCVCVWTSQTVSVNHPSDDW